MLRVVATVLALLFLSTGTAHATMGPDESGLQPNAVKVSRFVKERFPEIPRIGGWRPGRLPDHPSGRALDIMIPHRELGDRVLAALQEHAAELGIKYTIWCRHFWQPNGVSQLMADRGSPTANHYDHIHVSVY